MPGEPLGERHAGAQGSDDRDRLPRRQHADRQGSVPRPPRRGKQKVGVLVFVGDALEEPIDSLAAKAGELGLLGLRVFIFQEGRDGPVERGFREIARLSGGAYARFDTNAAGELAQLLKAAAVYAAGGLKALEKRGGSSARLLLAQCDKGPWPISSVARSFFSSWSLLG